MGAESTFTYPRGESEYNSELLQFRFPATTICSRSLRPNEGSKKTLTSFGRFVKCLHSLVVVVGSNNRALIMCAFVLTSLHSCNLHASLLRYPFLARSVCFRKCSFHVIAPKFLHGRHKCSQIH